MSIHRKIQVQALLWKLEQKSEVELRNIGLFIEAYCDPEVSIATRFVVDNLQRLLPRLNTDTAFLLESSHREALRKMLGSPSMETREELLIAAIQALGQMGDSTVLRSVQRLAKSNRQERVREAAEQCIRKIQELQSQDQARQTLLRGAGAPLSSGETLLRAAQEAGETKPDHLLRPASGEATSDDREEGC
jgi:hypothetical protein